MQSILNGQRYTPEQLGELLGKTTQTLSAWRKDGTGPAFIRLGTTIIYAEADVEEWLQQQRNAPMPANQKKRGRPSRAEIAARIAAANDHPKDEAA